MKRKTGLLPLVNFVAEKFREKRLKSGSLALNGNSPTPSSPQAGLFSKSIEDVLIFPADIEITRFQPMSDFFSVV